MPTTTQPEAVKEKVQPRASMEQIQTPLAEKSLYDFVKQAWPIAVPASFVSGRHIEVICKHLEAVTEGQIRNLIICVPPRHTKSTLVSVMWPAWSWIKNPKTRWVYFSYAANLSIRDSQKCRYVIQSPWYQRRWGNRFSLVGDQNAKEKFENDKRGFRQASSVGGQGTGEGGDTVVIDDPHNIKSVESELIRQGVIDWWDHVMPTRLNDPKKSSRVIIMQRSHESDMVGHIQEKNEQGWEWLVLPAEYDSHRACVTVLGDIDWRVKDNELLWPERFGKPEIDNLKQELGSYAYSAQFQQRPAPAGGLIFKREWFKFYDLVPDKFDSMFQSWDMTFKNKKDSDFVSGGVWGVIGADRYLLARVNDRLSFTETCDAVRGLSADWPMAEAKYIEDAANGPAVIDALHSEITGLIPVAPAELGSKSSRAYAVTPQFEAGNVYVPHPSQAPWVDEYINELCFFPRAKHDDDVDMTTLALIKAKDPRHAEEPPIVSITKESYWKDGLTAPKRDGGSDHPENWVGGLYRSSHV